MSNQTLNLKDEYTYKELLTAYLDCRKRKSTKMNSLSFERDFEKSLRIMLDKINNGTYKILPYKCFISLKPKAREIWSANFKDRIVHHLLYNTVGEWYEKRFIEDTYSCIKGRGTLMASQRAAHFARSITNNWDTPAWYLQIDIKNFFVSIDKNILWDCLKEDIGETSLTSRLFKQVIFNDPTVNARLARRNLSHLIPRHKSLWYCDKSKGLPIGNFTSQFLSNVYLNSMDHFVKHNLKCKYYVRYVDDMVLMSTDKDYLLHCKDEIDKVLIETKSMCLHPNKIKVAPVHGGINFVGAIVKPFRVYSRRCTVSSALRNAKQISKYALDDSDFNAMQSYLGMLKHTDSFHLREHLCNIANSNSAVRSNINYTKLIKEK